MSLPVLPNWLFALLLLWLLVLFLQADNRFWNKTPRREFVFWTSVIIAIAVQFIYIPLSRNYYLQHYAVLPVFVTLLAALPLIFKTKQVLRNRLTKFKQVSSSALIGGSLGLLKKSASFIGGLNEEDDSDEAMNHLLGEIVQSMTVLKSSLREIGGYVEHSRSQVMKKEKWIIEQLATMPKKFLNRILVGINLAVLIKDMRDHVLGENPPKNKTALLQILTHQRVDDLSLMGKAAIIDALQKIGFTAISNSDTYAQQIILNTYGLELTNLKRLIDLGGGTHNFSRLVFQDIQTKEIRDKILAHLDTEAQKVCADILDGKHEMFLKVISDIDDTLYCQLLDKRWPSRTFYPGVRKFYEELDKGADEKGTIGDLVFLTARPHGYKGGIEQLTHDMLGHSKLHTQPVILAGTFSHFFVNKDMAAKKYQNFEMYASVNTEYRFVFIGDSGQGDVAFGKEIKRNFHSKIKLILINDVRNTSENERKELEEEGVFYFDTYVGAAKIAYEHQLISKAGLFRVIEDARESFKEIASKWKDEEKKQQRKYELNKDIRIVNRLFPNDDIDLII